MIKNIITEQDYERLEKACNDNTDFTLNKHGLVIDLKFNPTGFTCTAEYVEPVQEEVDNFTEYCESFDDEVFVGICEYIGKDGLNKIQNCLDSDDMESVRSAIQYFKINAKDYVKNKIAEYENILSTI